MIRPTRLVPAALLCVALGLAACDSKSTSSTTPVAPAQPTQPTVPGVPALTATVKANIDRDFTAARAMITQARQHKSDGENAERSGGMQEAIPHYQKAIKLYRESQQLVEPWIEPELGQLTEAQVDTFMRAYVKEIGRWQKEKASMGKVPPPSK